MKHIKLFYLNGAIRSLFENEVEKRIRAEYSERKEREILRNMLVDTDSAVAYAKRTAAIKAEVKAEIEAALGHECDVGFDSSVVPRGMADRVDSLEATADELNEALTMILEGVVE